MKIQQVLTKPITVDFEESFHRYYTGVINRIPSVTTILNKVNNSDFGWYRDKKGRDNFEAMKKDITPYMDVNNVDNCTKLIGQVLGNMEMRESGEIGNQTHVRVEEFLLNKPFTPIDSLSRAHYDNIEPFLHEVSELYAIEEPMTNSEYSYAGKPDWIGKYRGKVTIGDNKTKKSIRKRDWVEDHFIQEGAYCKLWEDNGGPKIEQLVLLVSSRDNQNIAMEFIEEDPKPWVKKWEKILAQYQAS